MNEDESRTMTDDFDAHRLRTIADAKRSTEDRMLGGVCSGIAKYLNVDPVIVRIVIAVLTIVGFAGVILYAAAWLLLPSEDADQSIAANWFNLDRNEEQVRIGGLVVAGAIAVISVFGGHGHSWWGASWFLVGPAALYYFFVVRPRRRQYDAATTAALAGPAGDADQTKDLSAPITEEVTAKVNRKIEKRIERAREPKSTALTVLTLSIIAIGVALTRIYAELHDGASWTTYVAVALGITGLGLLIGTFVGNGGPLIALGLMLAASLAFGSALPSPKMGDQTVTPTAAVQVDGTYKHGIGLLELNLSRMPDADQLLGRTLVLDAGIGQTKVIVPRDLNVIVDAHLNAGDISVFDRTVNGTDNELRFPAEKVGAPTLTIKITQRLGNVEVVRS